MSIYAVSAGLAGFIVSLLLSVVSVYLGLLLFSRLTPKTDEFAELAKGNLAVGLMLASVVFAVALVVTPAIPYVSNALLSARWYALISSFVIVLVRLIAAVVSVSLAVYVFDRLSGSLDEFAEINKGNTAVAIVLSSVILATALFIRSSFSTVV
jgi:uncharacterized membrane protein YjfL (UPF0719 family)